MGVMLPMTGQFDYELKPRKIRARFHEHKRDPLGAPLYPYLERCTPKWKNSRSVLPCRAEGKQHTASRIDENLEENDTSIIFFVY